MGLTSENWRFKIKKIMPNYLFDCNLEASLRVDALSQKEAESTIRNTMNGALCNAGEWPSGLFFAQQKE